MGIIGLSAQRVLVAGTEHTRVVDQYRNMHTDGVRDEGLPEVEEPLCAVRPK